MRGLRLLTVMVAAGILTSCGEAIDPRFEDPEVGRIYANMMEAMAPDHGWDRARYIQFDWIVNRGGTPRVRSHRWDRYEGTYRYQAPTQAGEVIALFNVNDYESGQAWLDGVLQEGEDAQRLLRGGYGAFINDSYWFLMPYKWADPGVTTTYLGQQTDDSGRTWEVVELTFEDVGLTPQNKYHGYVNPETWVMEQWSHYRNAADPEPSFVLGWTEWDRYGPIMLSTQRPDDNGVSGIYFDNVVASETVPEGAFAPPAGP